MLNSGAILAHVQANSHHGGKRRFPHLSPATFGRIVCSTRIPTLASISYNLTGVKDHAVQKTFEPCNRPDSGRPGGIAAAGLTGTLVTPEVAAQWPRHDISRRKRGMFDKFIARDMDGDGDMDFVGTRGNSYPHDGVFWLEQVRSAAPQPAFQRARAIDSPEMPLP